MKSFGEVLSFFKKTEKFESLSPLLHDVKLQDAVIAWQAIRVKIENPGECEYKDERDQWDWLWKHVKYDQKHFGIVAGLKDQEIYAVLTRLRGLKLIYPDGTINVLAKQYIQAEIRGEIDKRLKATRKNAKNDKS